MYVCIYKLNVYFLEFPNFKIIIQYYLNYTFNNCTINKKKKNFYVKKDLSKRKKSNSF